jgi:hypothetical protein
MQQLQVLAFAQFGSLPASVDLIVMRHENTSAAKFTATAAKVSAAGAACSHEATPLSSATAHAITTAPLS